jgi:hypothetical protein
MGQNRAHSNEGKILKIKFEYHEISTKPTECSYLHLSLHPPQAEPYNSSSPFLLALGLNACGSNRYLSFDFSYQERRLPWKRLIRLPANMGSVVDVMREIGLEPPPSKRSSHEVKVEIHPNNTYSVWVDRRAVVWQGDLHADWDFIGEEAMVKIVRIQPERYREVLLKPNELTETNQKVSIDGETLTLTGKDRESLDAFYASNYLQSIRNLHRQESAHTFTPSQLPQPYLLPNLKAVSLTFTELHPSFSLTSISI